MSIIIIIYRINIGQKFAKNKKRTNDNSDLVNHEIFSVTYH